MLPQAVFSYKQPKLHYPLRAVRICVWGTSDITYTDVHNLFCRDRQNCVGTILSDCPLYIPKALDIKPYFLYNGIVNSN